MSCRLNKEGKGAVLPFPWSAALLGRRLGLFQTSGHEQALSLSGTAGEGSAGRALEDGPGPGVLNRRTAARTAADGIVLELRRIQALRARLVHAGFLLINRHLIL